MGDFLKVHEIPSDIAGGASDATKKLYVDMAEAQVRSFCGWHISEESGAVYTVDGPAGADLFLPTLALTAVTSVVENGSTLVVDTGYRWTVDGTVTRRGMSRWYDGFQSVVVTYDHGYAPKSVELLAVKQVVLAVVARLLDTPNERSTGYQAGLVSESFAAPPQVPSGLLYSEQGSLAPFVLPVVG